MQQAQLTSQVIAIDGPAGSGKSTVARLVAHRLAAIFLDTGAIYRCLALQAQRTHIDWTDAQSLAALARTLPIAFVGDETGQRVLLDGQDVTAAIRTSQISNGASQVSRYPAVRAALLQMQRGFARGQVVVAEGRDTGTAVFPNAALKVYLIASPLVRARRRHAELIAAGHDVSLDRVLAEQQARDETDSTRETAPLRAAPDAITVDTSNLTIVQVVERIVELAQDRRAEPRAE